MEDKVVLITNSTSGIGKETAFHFSFLGAKLVITGRRENDVSEVVQQCEYLSPNAYKPLGVVTNFSDYGEVKKLVQLTIETYIKLDVLVNNAGFESPDSDDDPDLIDIYRSITNTNFIIPLLLTQLCAPYLEETKGCIINVGSINIFESLEKWNIYSMSKVALDTMTKCYAIELRSKGIRVISVNPECVKPIIYIGTKMNTGKMHLFVDMRKSNSPSGRFDVAKVITFLASDAASSISRVLIQTDGANLYIYPLIN